MLTSSAKSKGRRLQKHVKEVICRVLGLTPDMVYSSSSSAPGTDVRFRSGSTLYSVECGNQEKISLWAKWGQCLTNAKAENATPILVVSRNRNPEPLAIVQLEFLAHLLACSEAVSRLKRGLE